MKELYRYSAYCYFEDYVSLILEEYPVIKETPKGYWIIVDKIENKKRFVLKKGIKCFARESKEKAFTDLIFRKKKAYKICSENLRKAKLALNYVNNYNFSMEKPKWLK